MRFRRFEIAVDLRLHVRKSLAMGGVMIMKKVDMMTYENGEERQQRIRERAYEIWEEEGCPQGRSDIHWLRASEEFEQAARNEAAADAAHAAPELPSTAKQSQETAPKKRVRPPRRS